jgi:flavorubredoxin
MNQPSTAREPIKILVLYDSLTGNVETMARLVAEGAKEIQGTVVRVTKVAAGGAVRATPDDVLWADGVAVGSPTNTVRCRPKFQPMSIRVSNQPRDGRRTAEQFTK